MRQIFRKYYDIVQRMYKNGTYLELGQSDLTYIERQVEHSLKK